MEKFTSSAQPGQHACTSKRTSKRQLKVVGRVVVSYRDRQVSRPRGTSEGLTGLWSPIFLTERLSRIPWLGIMLDMGNI